ncbi:MAG: hypothetical protein HQ565_09640 [Bacteroidetes bacterium]|nr:hypothetical protein [Bacteroidota bacterium]
MKKSTLIAGIPVFMIVLFFTVNAFSQKLYINAALGYGLGTQKSFFQMSSGNSYIYYDTVYENNKFELKRISFGQGANFEIGVGTFIGKHIAIEINGFYQMSQKNEIYYKDLINIVNVFKVQITQEKVIKGRMFGIRPNFVLRGGGDKIRPFLKIGGVIGFGKIIEEDDIIIYNPIPGYLPREDIESVLTYKRQLNLGYSAAIGFDVFVGEGTRFFVECAYTAINYVPISAEYTEYKYMGKDELNNLTTGERYYEFVDEYSTAENDNENTPTKSLKYPFSFSNIGARVGFIFRIIK